MEERTKIDDKITGVKFGVIILFIGTFSALTMLDKQIKEQASRIEAQQERILKLERREK